jgi:manganese/iron transport system permease protein
MSLAALVIEPLQHPFLQRALITAVFVALMCAVLSCFLVLKGWSLMGDAMAHAVLPGVVIAHALALPLTLGAFVAGLGCALGVGYLKANSRLKEDTVMGLVFAGLFALGLVLFVKTPSELHLMHVLFGNILGVQGRDLAGIAAACALLLALALLAGRDLVLFCFDPVHAHAIGRPVTLLHYGLLAAIALTVVSAMAAVGIILVVAMLIAPGALGFLLARRFPGMVMIALTGALTASLTGVLASFHLDVATAPLIVVIQAGMVALAFAWTQRPRAALKTAATAPERPRSQPRH